MADWNHERFGSAFPFVAALAGPDRERLARAVHFPVLQAGQVAYELGGPCLDYLLCIEGRTRIFRTSDAGREMLLYNVEGGGTCVLTTQCLLSRTNFPAESTAERRTLLAAIPADAFHRFMAEMPAFRDFVLADYTKLLGTMLSSFDALAFQTVEQRLARRLLIDADGALMIGKTHQQLAADIGSVREIVSRHLGAWEKQGWVENLRGQVRILDRAALATRRAAADA